MKAAFHTLGCKVNQYETEAISEAFEKKGYTIVDEREFADVYVVNTCTVTSVADRKSRQYIRRMKKVNPESIVVVAGCYAQISPEEVSKIEDADIIVGTSEKSRITDFVEEYIGRRERQKHVEEYGRLTRYDDMGMVTSAENRTRAYVKIQEGCDRFCSYCVIPYARGKVRSRDIGEIIKEVRYLTAKGYKEIVLTGINTALYGMEKEICEENLYGVEKVIAAVNDIKGDFRIRLSSLEPAVVNADYVERLLKYNKLCHHLHLSAQSGSDKILKDMNRPYSRDEYMDIVEVLRKADPLYGISTDIIVGFPGEKEQDFRESVRLVEECLFCKTHIFKYSKRPLTKAAGMKEHTAPQVKNRRSEELHEAARASAKKFFEMNKGTVHDVILEEISENGNMVSGYTENYLRVYVPHDFKDGILPEGIIKVRMNDIFEDGMTGEILHENI